MPGPFKKADFDGDDVVVKGCGPDVNTDDPDCITYTEDDNDKRCLDVNICNAEEIAVDEKVKCSSNDQTTGYLSSKLSAGNCIEITEINDGGAETCEIAYTTVAASAHLSNFTNYASSGYSGAIPMDTTQFKTVSTMHDPTVTDSGTATGVHSTTTLQDTSKSWTVNAFTNFYVRITGGTQANRWRKITSNTSDTLTFAALTAAPDNTSVYEITEFSTRLTAPVDGIYIVNAMVGYEMPTASPTTYGIRIDVNGSFNSVKFSSYSGITEHEEIINKALSLSSGDYIEIQAYQGTGSEKKQYGSSRMHVSLIKQ